MPFCLKLRYFFILWIKEEGRFTTCRRPDVSGSKIQKKICEISCLRCQFRFSKLSQRTNRLDQTKAKTHPTLHRLSRHSDVTMWCEYRECCSFQVGVHLQKTDRERVDLWTRCQDRTLCLATDTLATDFLSMARNTITHLKPCYTRIMIIFPQAFFIYL